MTGFIVSVFPFRNRASSKGAFEGLELGEGKPSRPVLRGLGSREAARPLGELISTHSRIDESLLPTVAHFGQYVGVQRAREGY